MKKSILTFASILIGLMAFAQPNGASFETKTFIIVPAVTTTADSIYIVPTDNGYQVSASISFYLNGQLVNSNGKQIVLWTGEAYIANKDWTNLTVRNRVKELLGIE